ncbi:hypothetical protein DVR12_17650 [Chitinophaga silvatica]|uniref:RHS repeat-associated core domain-containing protein n=1 Tax=Chitinophaga silvatica TaxID=2282649 RepID=A0A3E1Y7V0_9BACT|nr:RHS repeat-associated core domain-containing protein [Chitinophaga silvatica]RFS21160.1 hypothetical protein DVR12_17650 [Chitinophaga silvatica]
MGSYRYGFNGKENDNEVKGEGNQVVFEARVYDPRVGRFLSCDPLGKEYAFQSSYAFAANSPIKLIDALGLAPDDPPKTLYTNTQAGKQIFTEGFNASAHGKYSKYNWFSTEANASNTGRTGLGISLQMEGINVSDAHIITKEQTSAWELEAIKEMGYDDKKGFSAAKKSMSKEAFSDLYTEMRGRMYDKVGKYMDSKNLPSYILERDGTYAVSDAAANSGTIKSISGSAVAVKALNGLKWGGRVLMTVAVAKDLYDIYNSGFEVRTIVTKLGFWGGAWAGGSAAGTAYTATGLDLAGPWGWVGHGVSVIAGGAVGGFLGQEATKTVYDYVTKPGVKPGMK